MDNNTWSTKQLKNFAHLEMGQSPPGDSYNDTGEGIPFLQGKTTFGSVYPSIEKYTTDPKKIGKKGSVLMSVRAPVGDVNIADIDYCIGRGLASIDATEGDNNYLFYLLRYMQPLIASYGTGTTFKSINKSILETVDIPTPPLEEQKKIAAVLSTVQNAIEKKTELISSLLNLKESLLRKVFDQFDNYEKMSVKDLVKLNILSKPLDGNHGERHPKGDDFISDGIPFIVAADLVKGKVNFDDCAFISLEQAKTLRKGFLENGDVLISHKGTIGRTAILDSQYDLNVLSPQVTYYRVLDHTKIAPKYLYYYFQSNYFQSTMKNWASTGSTRAYLGITRQLDLPILLTDTEKQLKTVSKLETLDYNINSQSELLHRLNELFDSLLENLMSAEIRVNDLDIDYE